MTPAIPLLDIYLKELKIENQTDTCAPTLTAALFTIVKRQKQTKCPLASGQIKKMPSICTMEHFSAVKRNEMLTRATICMDFENTLKEVSQAQEDRCCMIPLI